MEDERWGLNGRQGFPNVDISIHACKSLGRSRARAHPQICGPPTREALVAHHAGGTCSQADRAAPSVPYFLQERLVRVPTQTGGIVGGEHPSRIRADHDESSRPRRVGRREESAHRPSFGHPHERRAFGSHSVHDCSDIAHPLLEGRKLVRRHTIGETRSALVEEDEA